MARKPTKILIVTATCNNYERIIQALKNTLPNNSENRIIYFEQDLFPHFEREKIELFIIDLPSLNEGLENILPFLSCIRNDIPSLIVYSKYEIPYLERLLENRDFIHLLPQKWLENKLLKSCIRRAFININKKHEIDEKLRSMDLLRQNLPGMVFLQCVDDEQRIMKYIGSACQELTGYAEEDLFGNPVISCGDLIQPEDHEMVGESIRSAIEKGAHYKTIYRVNAKGKETGLGKWGIFINLRIALRDSWKVL